MRTGACPTVYSAARSRRDLERGALRRRAEAAPPPARIPSNPSGGARLRGNGGALGVFERGAGGSRGPG